MKSIRLNLSALIRPLRVVVAACVCAFLLFTAAAPAYSANSDNPSHPRSGEANLLDIERKSQEAVMENPYTLKETQIEANKGLNEIQGDSDFNQMKRPENSTGMSVEDKIEKALEKVTGN